VLSNLGLSYVLSKDLPKAEETLRRAHSRADADPRVRQNLGLVVGLQGRLAEAENIVKAGRPPEEAAADVAYLRRLLSRKENARASADKP
jgi:Flp pilus assembly protein TadD